MLGGFFGSGTWHILPKTVGEMGEAATPGGALEKYVDTDKGLCGSFRQRDGQDGYSVPNFFN